MKKLLFIAIAAVIAVGFAACSDNDDDDRFIALSQLPGNAQSFISAYFGGADVFKVTTENKSSGTEYKVTFRNGYEVEFDATGSWTDVDAPSGRTVPVGIAPAAIQNYVDTYFPADGINEISRDYRGYEVELLSGIDLTFNPDGQLVEID
ncbi:MAG: PepSY-like domain-containing protein [Muribaculaceae bacterium]|nr:PepSY-like domain-containing protein [Muribaculaceae bacterium]